MHYAVITGSETIGDTEHKKTSSLCLSEEEEKSLLTAACLQKSRLKTNLGDDRWIAVDLLYAGGFSKHRLFAPRLYH